MAALLIANGVTGPDSVREALQNTAKDLGASGRDDAYGYGLINAYAALTYSPEPVHDVAIASMSAPSSVLEGDVATITVQASNPGDYTESFDVTVSESPDGVPIGTETVKNLAAGASLTLTFTWDTAGASPGDHTLTATAGDVAGETNLTNNSAEAVVKVHGPGVTMHVESIKMSAAPQGPRKVMATAVVTVFDEAAMPVSGATVHGSWSDATTADKKSVTNDAGQATFKSGLVKGGGTFVFTVTDIVKEGYAYDPTQNKETSDLITYP